MYLQAIETDEPGRKRMAHLAPESTERKTSNLWGNQEVRNLLGIFKYIRHLFDFRSNSFGSLCLFTQDSHYSTYCIIASAFYFTAPTVHGTRARLRQTPKERITDNLDQDNY